MVEKMVTGGQTGVDRAAMDVALEFGIPLDGWCPRGRRAEDGPIDVRYDLKETESAEYDERTRLNVRDSDGTLILSTEAYSPGTSLTVDEATELTRPLLIVHLEDASADNWEKARRTEEWIREHDISALNVAGPRESESPGIYQHATTFLRDVLAE